MPTLAAIIIIVSGTIWPYTLFIATPLAGLCLILSWLYRRLRLHKISYICPIDGEHKVIDNIPYTTAKAIQDDLTKNHSIKPEDCKVYRSTINNTK